MIKVTAGLLALGITAIAPMAPMGFSAVLDSVAGPEAGAATQGMGQEEQKPIDLNAADAEALQKVPGIGEALAKRIVDFRKEHGPFEKVDDLLNVRGIGTTSLEKLRPYLTVKPAK